MKQYSLPAAILGCHGEVSALALNRYAVFIELILLGFVHRSQVAHGLETLVWGFQCQWVVREQVMVPSQHGQERSFSLNVCGGGDFCLADPQRWWFKGATACAAY